VGFCTSSTRTSSRSCPSWWTSSSGRSGWRTRRTASTCRRSSSSARGSAATGTAILSSRTTSRVAPCSTNRIACLRRYRQRVVDLLRALSVTERAAPTRPRCSARRSPARWRRPATPSGSSSATRARVYRQFVTCMLHKLDAALTSAERRETGPEATAYRAADELIRDLRTLEAGLGAAGQRACRRAPRPSGAPGSGGIPLLDLPARRPRQLATRERRGRRAVARLELGRAACAGVARMAHLAAERAGPPARPRTGRLRRRKRRR